MYPSEPRQTTSEVVTRLAQLRDVVGASNDVHAVSPLAWAVIEGLYPHDLIERIRNAAEQCAAKARTRFLDLTMVPGAHRLIPEVNQLVTSKSRLSALSRIAGVELEPYPIAIAASHVNYYASGRLPLAFHSDGAAMVELIPLDAVDSTAATLVFRGARDDGLRLIEAGNDKAVAARIEAIPHQIGHSILMQGRRLLHSGSQTSYDRKLLVLAMRAIDEPWKDDNTIARLAMDYEPTEFIDEWVADELGRKLPALRARSIGSASDHHGL